MASNVQELRPKSGDTEKITMNLGYIDLGRIDLMVQEGFYSNRTDFIRTAVRNQLERHAEVVKQSAARKSLELGLRHYTRDDLETVRARLDQERFEIASRNTSVNRGVIRHAALVVDHLRQADEELRNVIKDLTE